MTPFQRSILALAIIALLLAGWMGRYSLVTSSPRTLVLDRWTGKVSVPHFFEPD